MDVNAGPVIYTDIPRGCVTPKLVSNINNTMEEEGSGGDGDEKDYSAIDGYEEIPEEFQEKVRHALEQGHVDDEDWKGVSMRIHYTR